MQKLGKVFSYKKVVGREELGSHRGLEGVCLKTHLFLPNSGHSSIGREVEFRTDIHDQKARMSMTGGGGGGGVRILARESSG